MKRLYFDPADVRLGRHVVHDPRSRAFPFQARSLGALRSVRHRSHIGVLQQGQLGSCTGNASTKCVSYGPFWKLTQRVLVPKTFSSGWAAADEAYAVGVYSEATSIDAFRGSYPPNDTGSSGLAVAKVFQRRGLIGGYEHAFSLEAALSAIARQSVIVGISWYSGMFTPGRDGFIRPTGDKVGGHEICVDQINVEGRYVEFPNSWGPEWGINGRARVSWDDFGSLLDDNGDVTVFKPVV